MHGRYLGRIVPDLDVCDVNGEKIGTVAQVYRYELAAVGGGHGESPPAHDEVVEVKTGFLGLGKHLYVPMSAIQDVTAGCVFVSRSRDDIDDTDWEVRPAYLDELR